MLTDAYAHADHDACDCNSDAYPYTNLFCDSDPHAHGHSNTHLVSNADADRHADTKSVAASLFAHAYHVKVKNLGGLSAKAWTRRELDRLGIGKDLQVIPWGSRMVKLPPSSLR